MTLLATSFLYAGASPRRYEVYSDTRDTGSDFVGTELDLILWEDSVDATLTIYRNFSETSPVRLQGTAQDHEVFLSVSQGEETLEIGGRRSPERFTGEMTYKRKGSIVRTDPLDLPRKTLK